MADEHAGRIAVIGFAGRFPGAADVATLWRNVLAARSGLTRVGPDDLRSSGADPALLERPGYVPVTGALDDVECFDAGLFGYSAREAALLDPQHRHFLEMCWAAMESAGYDPAGTTLPVGVFAGARINTYLLENLLPHRGRFDQLGQLGTLIGND
jgi:acyl transferase domain-containing protein